MMYLEDMAGWLALITSLIGLAPQIYKAYISKSTNDLSMLYLINYFVCSLCWIVYGHLTHSLFVVYSNVLGMVSCIFLIAQKMRYDAASA